MSQATSRAPGSGRSDPSTLRRAFEPAAPFLVALLAFAAFLPALQNGFVAWDDDANFLKNPSYRGLGWKELRWMWTTFHLGHYVPLTWMTFGVDYSLWGLNPVGYHAVNDVLHAANAVLLYYLARRLLRLVCPDVPAGAPLTLAAMFSALLFAIHPLRVESVAWITERRDVLSQLFCLASVLCYLRGRERRERLWYGWALVTFVCALLSKATAVTLPALLLVLNVHPLRRLGGSAGWWSVPARRVYYELVPFAVLAAATSLLSIVALDPPGQLPPSAKLAVSAYSLSFYLWKTVVPEGLSPLYAMPKQLDPFAPLYVASCVFVVTLTAGAWLIRRRWPGATTAWVAFLVTILPMLGVVQNGPQIAADRYTYHAAPALTLLVVGAVLGSRRLARPVTVAAGAGLVLLLGVLTWRQTLVWRDSESLWTRVLTIDDESSIAHIAMANALVEQDRAPEALAHCRRAVELDPRSSEAENNLGVALARQGDHAGAVEHYRRALALRPDYHEAHNNLGAALARQGDLTGAIEQYEQALAIQPGYAEAHVNWGNALVRMNEPEEAIPHYQAAVAVRPDHAEAHHNWGMALARQGRLDEAIGKFRQALAINPDHAEAREYLDRTSRLLMRQQSPARAR